MTDMPHNQKDRTMEEQNSNDIPDVFYAPDALPDPLTALSQVVKATVNATNTGSPLRAIYQHAANLHRDMIRVAQWAEDHIEHIEDVRMSAVASIWITTHETREAYDALTVALQRVADLGSIEPPGESGGSFTYAKAGEVRVYIYASGSVCERVVVGTQLVEKPDPAAPMVVVREPVYEYRCSGEEVES